MTMRAAAVLGIALFAGCSGDGDDASVDGLVRCPLGDSSAAPEMEIVHLDADLTVIDTTENAAVPLLVPPQGGWILMIGVRATNIDGCQLNLTTSFRDIDDPAIIKLDQRPAKLEPTSDGWGISTPSTVGNLPICPQVTALRDLYDQPYIVTVAIEDIDGRSASRDVTIVPTCPAGDPRCSCECDRDYVLGGPCPPAAR